MYKYLLLIFTFCQTILSAQMSVKTERPSGRYEAGEIATFKVTGAASGAVSYQIKRTLIDTFPLLASGTAAVVNGAGEPVPVVATAAGVRTYETLMAVRDVGVTRVGATATKAILEDAAGKCK